jgi:hypothetical protein
LGDRGPSLRGFRFGVGSRRRWPIGDTRRSLAPVRLMLAFLVAASMAFLAPRAVRAQTPDPAAAFFTGALVFVGLRPAAFSGHEQREQHAKTTPVTRDGQGSLSRRWHRTPWWGVVAGAPFCRPSAA